VSDRLAAEVMSRPLAKGWQWMQLGQYVENHDGRRVPISQKERETRRGDFPYYGASGVIDTIDGHTHDGEFVLIGEDGANLLTRSKPIAFQAKGKIWVNNHAHVLRCKPGFSNAYLAYYINSIDLSPYVTGTAQPKLSQSMMNKIPVPVAPPEQQVEIVAEIDKQFSRLDEAVANLQRVKANLKCYKASVLKAAVEGRLVETEASIARREGRGYETGEQLLQRILEERQAKWSGKGKYKEPIAHVTNELPELPEGWTWARLDSLAALKGGITVDSKRVDPSARSVPYLRVANVQRGFIDLAEVKYINASPSDIDELRLELGDVLFNEGGDRDKLGRGWIWEGQLVDCIHQNHVFRARMYLGAMSPKLVSWWGNTFGKDYFLRVGKQTTNLASINLGKLSEFPVPVPPKPEQLRMVAEIERLLSVVEEVEGEVNTNLQRAQALRQATLEKAFATDK
jgi:type I restriction enzyme, S subunit